MDILNIIKEKESKGLTSKASLDSHPCVYKDCDKISYWDRERLLCKKYLEETGVEPKNPWITSDHTLEEVEAWIKMPKPKLENWEVDELGRPAPATKKMPDGTKYLYTEELEWCKKYFSPKISTEEDQKEDDPEDEEKRGKLQEIIIDRRRCDSLEYWRRIDLCRWLKFYRSTPLAVAERKAITIYKSGSFTLKKGIPFQRGFKWARGTRGDLLDHKCLDILPPKIKELLELNLSTGIVYLCSLSDFIYTIPKALVSIDKKKQKNGNPEQNLFD